jgi:segregation and condensation protein A
MFEQNHKRRELAYQVKLEHFEGPMDLLLHLIRRDKINIYDIPISHITHEYLSYIEIMKELELEVAGEFFVMAATLMRIKVQMLLPKRVIEEEEEDPREELVRNLIEYRKFKKAADHLAGKESSRRDVFVRPAPEYIEEKDSTQKMELSLFDLMDAFKTLLKDLRKEITYRVEIESHSVDEKIDFVKEKIESNSEILFTELIKEAHSRIEIIATLLAILELIHGGFIVARQMSDGNDIWIYRREDVKVVER